TLLFIYFFFQTEQARSEFRRKQVQNQEDKNRVLPANEEAGSASSATFGDEEAGSTRWWSGCCGLVWVANEERCCCGWLWVARWFLESGAWWAVAMVA
ncbi:hypothetical protein HN873_063222, partial [Arachis hypogaea]